MNGTKCLCAIITILAVVVSLLLYVSDTGLLYHVTDFSQSLYTQYAESVDQSEAQHGGNTGYEHSKNISQTEAKTQHTQEGMMGVPMVTNLSIFNLDDHAKETGILNTVQINHNDEAKPPWLDEGTIRKYYNDIVKITQNIDINLKVENN